MNVWLIAQETDAFTRWHAHVGPIDAEVKRIFVGHTCSLPGIELWSPPAPPHHHPDDPVRPEESAHWPFNILCPATALSWWIADQVQARLTDEDHPTHIVALEDPLLLYFLAQRQAIDASFLPHTQLAITLHEPWLPSPQERPYRLPLYWQDEVRRAACWMARDLFQYNPQTEPTVRQLLSDDTNEAPLYAITELKERFLKTSLVEQSSDTFPFADAPLRKGYCIEALPESPELTVIIPCYNLGNYVDEAIESALASEGVDFSILLVDDGSTDPLTQERLDAWEAREEPRLKIIRRTNHGLAATRNFGAAEAQTPYLAFLDADDAVEPDFFRKALTILQRYRNVHHVSTWVRTFGDQDGIWSAWNTTLPFFLGHNLFIPICVGRAFCVLARTSPRCATALKITRAGSRWWKTVAAVSHFPTFTPVIACAISRCFRASTARASSFSTT